MNVCDILRDLDAVVITSLPNLHYLSGIDNADAVILLSAKGCYYITNPLYEVEVHCVLPKWLTSVILPKREEIPYLNGLLKGASRVGMELTAITVSKYRLLTQPASFSVSDITDRLASLRAVKTIDELARIKHAEGIVDKAFARIVRDIRVDMTEKNVRNLLQQYMYEEGADGIAFDTIVAFGENAAKPHAVPSERRLKNGDCIVMDFGAKYAGYCSDFTRTIFCGEPSPDFIAAYDAVLRAHMAALAYLSDGGRQASEAHMIASNVINATEYRGLFNHSLGHGVGVEIHETPYLAANSKDVLDEGNVFTIEPGVYAEDRFGIRIESLAAIENGIVTVIDRSNKEIITV